MKTQLFVIMQLSPSQQIAFDKFSTGQNIFISGPGGHGKTFLINEFKKKSNVTLCAMTGCAAAVLHKDARTIHSWSGIKLARGTRDHIISNIPENAIRNWESVQTLIIDEVSMLSAEIFELLNEIAQKIRQTDSLFGGIQLVFSGDFYQLPPFSEQTKQTKFCFESPLWFKIFAPDCHIELKENFRQSDPAFVSLLNNLRVGKLTKRDVEIIENRMKCSPGHNSAKIYPKKKSVEDLNQKIYQALKTEEVVYNVEKYETDKYLYQYNVEIDQDDVKYCDTFSKSKKEEEYENLIKENNVPRSVSLKIGSKVMCLVNFPESNIWNGSQGVVSGFNNKSLPIVKFSNEKELVIKHSCYQSEKHPIFCVRQIPLCLSWALTIHKIQGTTLDAAEIDIGSEIFAPGQSYVAVSRIRSLDGLFVRNFSKKNIRVHNKVKQFYNKMFKN